MECVQLGFPCSMAEMSDEVHDSAIAILLDALEALDKGTMADARAFLEGHPDVIEVLGDEDALRFRIEGSTPLWLMDLTGVIPEEAPAAPKSLAAPNPFDGVDGFGTKGIVGEDTNQDGKTDNEDDKRALVLAPYEWQFKPWDESELLAGQLQSLRGYEGNVTFKHNPAKEDQNLTLADYALWRQHDLIYIATHGQRVCSGMPQRCAVVISSGVHWDLDNRPEMISVPGAVPLGLYDRRNGYTRQYVELGLTADFFRSVYGEGLDKTLVQFSACETGASGAAELAQALGGDDFVMFGWTEVVPSRAAFQGASLLLEKLGEGLPADSALDEVRKAGFHSAVNSRGVTTVLTRYAPNGGDQRLFELPVLLDEDDEEIEDGDNITPLVEGSVGDGQSDRLKLRLRIDGVEESNRESFSIKYRLDDSDLPGTYDLSSASPIAEYQYLAEHEIDLGRDIKPGQDLPLEVIVDLPEGGESRFTVDVTFSQVRVAVYYLYFAEVGLPANSVCDNPDQDREFKEDTITDGIVDPTEVPPESDYWVNKSENANEPLSESGTRFFNGSGGMCSTSAGFSASATLTSSLSVPKAGDQLDIDINGEAESNCETPVDRLECADAASVSDFFARFDAPIEEETALRLQINLDCKSEYPAGNPFLPDELTVQVFRFSEAGDPMINHPTKLFFAISRPCRTGDGAVRVDQVIDFSAPAGGTVDRAVVWVSGFNAAGGNVGEGSGTVSRNSFMRGEIKVTPTSPTP